MPGSLTKRPPLGSKPKLNMLNLLLNPFPAKCSASAGWILIGTFIFLAFASILTSCRN